VVFLNHGSFGACPRAVLQAQSEWRRRMEADPVRFFVKEISPGLDAAREALAPIVGAHPADLALLPNATTAVATVLDNLRLEPGDEILVNTHEYNACVANCRQAAEKAGARVVAVDLPWPVQSEQQVVDAIMACVTDRTRLCLFSLVTSTSAIVMPAAAIVEQLHARGVEILLDAAHGPGCVPMDLGALGVAYATGNAHKWLCAPKGCAFLYVRQDKREGLRPLVLSNAAFGDLPTLSATRGQSVYHLEFDYCGTTDVTPMLTLPASVQTLAGLHPEGLGGVMATNRALALEGRRILCEALGTEPPVPESMIGPLATVTLPPHPADLHARVMAEPTVNNDPMWERLQANWGIQVPVHYVLCAPGAAEPRARRVVRISPQLYNSTAQYAYLGEALSAELAWERDF
jgi:isopenicillin-N epimerase